MRTSRRRAEQLEDAQMTFALWSLFIAMWLPLIWAVAAKWGLRNYDNSAPRKWLERQEGFRQRAAWAQSNAWEAFAQFAAAVLTAHYLGANQTWANGLAAVFVVARIFHGVFYWINRPMLRSIAWTIGLSAVTGLFVAAALA